MHYQTHTVPAEACVCPRVSLVSWRSCISCVSCVRVSCISRGCSCPSICVMTAPTTGSIMAVDAVLLIHIDMNHVGSMKPSINLRVTSQREVSRIRADISSPLNRVPISDKLTYYDLIIPCILICNTLYL